MMRCIRHISNLTLGMIFLAPTAFAVNLIDVYHDAQTNDPELAGALASFNVQKENVPQAKALLLPRVDGSAIYQDTTNDSDNPIYDIDSEVLTYGVSVTQPLFNAQGWHAFKAAKDIESQAEAEYLATQQNLLLRSAEAYFNVLLAQENLALSYAEEKAVGRQLDQSEHRFKVGLIAITEVHEAQAAFDNAKTERIARANDLAISFDGLEALTGKFYPQVQRLNKKMPIESLTPEPLNAWETEGLTKNFSIQSAQFAVNSLKNQVKQEKSARLPSVNVRGSYQDINDLAELDSGTQDRSTTSISVELTVPIFTGFGQTAAIKQTRYREDAAKHQLETIKRAVKRNIRSLHRTITSDKERIAARKQSIVSSESALEATEVGYEVGTRNIVEVLNAQRTLFASQRDYASVRYDYILNILRLKAQAGSLKEQDLIGLNEWLMESNPIKFPN